MDYDKDTEIEIDLWKLFLLLKQYIWVIVLVMIAGCSAMYLYTSMMVQPIYTSSTMLYILNKTTNITSLADLQTGTQLTKDYKILVTSRPVAEQVIENLGLGISYEQLISKVKIDNPTDTRILTISVSDPEPEMAKMIADEFAVISTERMAKIMDTTPPNIVEEGNIPKSPTSPNVKKNTVIGGIAAGLVACGILFVSYILNDTIQTSDDIERYLNLNTLASIPVFEDVPAENTRRKKKRKNRLMILLGKKGA